ncbi:MAG: multi-sensor signal transduction histidine kinase [Bryobacterales bacterium]|nr:multi-sensor signal transduction histidine kinase [Bryobacterales bacterium]
MHIRTVLRQALFLFGGANRLNGYDDEPDARAFHLLLIAFLVWVGIMEFLVVPLFVVRKVATMILLLVVGGAALAALGLLRRGFKRAAAAEFLCVTWCAAGVTSLLSGGGNNYVAWAIVVILAAGWLLSRSVALAFAAATILVSFIGALLQHVSRPLPLYFPGAPLARWAGEVGIVLLAVGPLLAFLEALRRQASSIRESEERFRSLFEQAPIAYHEIDQQGVIRRVNRASCVLLGYAANELVGKFVWDFIVPELREAGRQALIGQLDGSRPVVPIDLEILCNDGSPIQVEIHETLIHGRAGEIVGLRAALLDNRQRKIAEEASLKAEQYNLELKINNDALAAALESARQANLIKTRFLANMSHELRTPLNGVIGLSEVLHDELAGELSPAQKEYVGDILASGRHLLNLVTNLLDLERVELGKMEFHPQVVDIQQLLKEVRDVLRTLADEKRVTMSVTIDPVLSAVTTDPVRLRQIVYNYLSNAIKFSPTGSVVRLRAAFDGHDNFRVEVTDQGPGLPPELLSSIFSDQLDRTQKREGQGAGLGLALTKRIVEAQGGTVGVQSVPGAGSTFHATLPNGRNNTRSNE